MSIAIPAIPSFAAEPQLQFELNRDSKSYELRIQNPSGKAIHCASLEITVEIGNPDCTRISSTNTQTLRNIKIGAGGLILDSNHGIDHLDLVNRKLNQFEKKVYCGQPEVKATCQ